MVEPVKPFKGRLSPINSTYFTYIPAASPLLNQLSTKIVLLITLVFFAYCCEAANDIENGIIGSPTVECEKEYIRFKVPTKNVFRGKVYVKGEYTNEDCVHSYLSSHESESHSSQQPDHSGLGIGRANGRQSPSPSWKPNKSGSEESASQAMKSSSRTSSKEKTPSTSSNRSSLSASGEGEDYEQEARSEEEQRLRAGEYPQPPPVIFTKEKGKGSATLGPPTDAEFEVTDTYNGQQEEHKGNTIQLTSSSTSPNKRTNAKDLYSHSGKSHAFTPRVQSSHLPGFSATTQTANWRNFLRGRPGLDGQSFRRYGSKVSPDANGECPLICPPCDDCTSKYTYEGSDESGTRRRRKVEHTAELEIRLGTCNTRRDRMASPPGVHISFTVIVSFHDSFITKVDRAYHIECAYEESDHTVTTQMDVSQPPTVQLSGTVQPPHCQYRIKAPGQGGVITNVRVGDSVQHEWHCKSAEHESQLSHHEDVQENASIHKIFGLLIHDCYIDDGKGRKERVVDNKGCSTDVYILPTPTYSSNSLSAEATSLVAKFPDRDLLGFQCSITVCMKELGHCEGVTPPKCNGDAASQKYENNVRRRRSQPTKESNTSETVNDKQERGQDEYWQLHAQMLTVFDFDAESEQEEKPDVFSRLLVDKQDTAFLPASTANEEPLKERSLLDISTNFCVSVAAFGILVASSTFLVTISTAAIFAILLWKNTFYIEK